MMTPRRPNSGSYARYVEWESDLATAPVVRRPEGDVPHLASLPGRFQAATEAPSQGRFVLLACFGFIAAPRPGDAESFEALLQRLLAQHGLRAADRLHGPFSWIAWDRTRELLVACRDRFGLEPIHWGWDRGRLVLASRPSTVLSALGSAPAPSTDACLAHLHGMAPDPEGSFLAEIHTVPPGTVAEFQRPLAPPSPRSRRYWQAAPGKTLRLSGEAEYGEALATLLGEIAADYSSPACSAVSMSGGLDSTAVAAFLRVADGQPGSENLLVLHRAAPDLPEADESARALTVARHLALRAEVIRGDQAWPMSRPDGIETRLDTPLVPPFADPWEASFRRAAQLGVQVIHTGAGGDHLFGGTHHTPHADLLLSLRWLSVLRQLRAHRIRSGRPWRSLIGRGLVRPLLRAVVPRWRPAFHVCVPWLARGHRKRWAELHRQLAFPPLGGRWLLPSKRDRLRFFTDGATPALAVELAHQARRHGVELRHPLLDARLQDFAIRLPADQVFRDGVDKAILRRALHGLLPADFLWSAAKTYPHALFWRGLRERGTADARRLLRDMRSAELGWVDEARLREAYEAYRRGETGGGGLLWNALTLEDWLRRHY